MSPVPAVGPTLLQYELTSSPDPLQAGAAGAQLTLIASNGGEDLVECTSIALTVVAGPNAKDLLEAGDVAGLGTQVPDGWSVAGDGATRTFTPAGGGAKIGRDAVVFVLDGIAVNDQPGTTPVTIAETASAASDPPATRSAVAEVPKFPAQFAVSELSAEPLDVAYGGSTTLEWTGSPAKYTLDYDPGSGPEAHDVGPNGGYVAKDLTRFPEVVFDLVVEVTVPGQDEPLTTLRQLIVPVGTAAPTVTCFKGSVSAGQAVFSWSSANADSCALNALPGSLNASGTTPALEVDRLHYTLVAHSSQTRADSAPSAVDLELATSLERALDPLPPTLDAASTITLTSDGSTLVVVGWANWAIDVYSVDASTLATKAHVSYAVGGQPLLAVSPDGKGALVYRQADDLSWWLTLLSLPALEQEQTVEAPMPGAAAAAFSPDGRTIYVPTMGNLTVHVLDASSLQTQRSFPVPDLGSCVVSPDGGRLYIAGESVFVVCDTASGAVLGQPAIAVNAVGLALDPLRNRAYAGGFSESNFSIVDTAAFETLATIGVGLQPSGVALSPTGAAAFVANSAGQSLSVVDTTTLAVTNTVPLGEQPVDVVAAPSGLRLYVLTQGGNICVLEPRDTS